MARKNPKCHITATTIDEKGIEYEEVDATTMDDIAVVPVTVIGDTKIVGFDRPAIKRALKAHKENAD